MAAQSSNAIFALRGLAAATVVCGGWVAAMRMTGGNPLVSDLVFALPAVVVILSLRSVRGLTRAGWIAAALGASALIHLLGTGLDLRTWPATPVGAVRRYAGIAYESLSWSLSPVLAALFVRNRRPH